MSERKDKYSDLKCSDVLEPKPFVWELSVWESTWLRVDSNHTYHLPKVFRMSDIVRFAVTNYGETDEDNNYGFQVNDNRFECDTHEEAMGHFNRINRMVIWHSLPWYVRAWRTVKAKIMAILRWRTSTSNALHTQRRKLEEVWMRSDRFLSVFFVLMAMALLVGLVFLLLSAVAAEALVGDMMTIESPPMGNIYHADPEGMRTLCDEVECMQIIGYPVIRPPKVERGVTIWLPPAVEGTQWDLKCTERGWCTVRQKEQEVPHGR